MTEEEKYKIYRAKNGQLSFERFVEINKNYCEERAKMLNEFSRKKVKDLTPNDLRIIKALKD